MDSPRSRRCIWIGEPKKLVILPGGHFDAYGAGFAQASAAARDWFVAHLRG